MSGAVATFDRPTVTSRRASTPGRLRVWTVGLLLGAIALLAVASTGFVQLSSRITVIGGHDAPQAETASDIYFALSDLDTQAATLIMLGDSHAMSINRLNALSAFRTRNAEVDIDLQQAERTAGNAADRDRVGALSAALASYREWVWQALAVEEQLPGQTPGRPPRAAAGYYAEATSVLRGQLLPTAQGLRAANQDDLARAIGTQRTMSFWAVGLMLFIGAVLIGALIGFQRSLARRYRRIINPALLLATVCVTALVIAACLVFVDETSLLARAQRDDFGPYLALTQAQAVSYDTAGDASRYLVASDPALIQAGMKAKSGCLDAGGACQSGAVLPTGGLATLIAGPDIDAARAHQVLDRWNAYVADTAHVLALAQSGQFNAAIDTLTGISQGDAAIDLYVYNATLTQIADGRRAAYTTELAHAQRILTPWKVLPAALMIITMMMILLGVRPRLAEYR